MTFLDGKLNGVERAEAIVNSIKMSININKIIEEEGVLNNLELLELLQLEKAGLADLRALDERWAVLVERIEECNKEIAEGIKERERMRVALEIVVKHIKIKAVERVEE